MSSRRHIVRFQRGFGLVEIMIALVLGLLLIAAAVQVFLGNSASHRYNEALATLQDNARFVLHTLERDFRMAGYTGCPASPSIAPSVGGDSRSPYGSVNVIAQNDDGQPVLDGDDLLATPLGQPSGVDGSSGDAVRIEYMQDRGVRLTSAPTGTGAALEVGLKPSEWGSGDILMVTDCRQADIFSASSFSVPDGSPPAIGHAALSTTYPEGARVLKPYAARYYTGDTGNTDDAGNAIQALYRQQMLPATTSPDALVNGITDLTLRYGVDNNGDGSPDTYIQGSGVSNWNDVVSIRVGFIAESEERAGAGASSGGTLTIFDNTVSVPDDDHLRRVFSTTIALRNRVP